MTTDRIVGVIIAICLLTISYLVFSAEPPPPFEPQPITSTEQFDFMTDCLAEKSSHYPRCENKWNMIKDADKR